MATAPAAPDTALVARLRQRDLSAWEEVYRLYSDRLYRFGYQLTGSSHDAADLVQETFVRALPRLDRLDPEGLKLGAYLLTTEKNLFLKSIAWARRQEPVEIVPEPAEPAPLEDDPERATLLVGQQEEVRLANAVLAPRQRLVLALRELEDRSYVEIGELVGLNENAVAQLISRARQRLREELRLVQVDQSKLPAECQAFLPLLSSHLDGQLKGAERERTLAHLESCSSCQAALEDMREASRRYRSLLPPLIGTELFGRVHDALAASAYWDGRRRPLLRRIAKRPRARVAVSAALAGLVVAAGGVVIASRQPSTATAETRADPGAPSLVLPANAISVEATSRSGARVTYPASAHDDVDGAVAPSCSPASGTRFPLGKTTVECTAADGHGNAARGSFTVTVLDSSGPRLTLPQTTTAEATGPAGARVSYRAAARDRVDGSIAPSCTPASGTTFPFGTTRVRCSAVDADRNKTSGSFTVRVVDTTPPRLRLPADRRVEAVSGAGSRVAYTATARDLVEGVVAARCAPASRAVFPLGTTTVRCNSSDAHGNSARGSFTVTVADTRPPELTLPAVLSVEATGPSGAPVSYKVSARDRVDGSVSPSCTPASGTTFPLGTTSVRCTASDSRGNAASGGFQVTVVDTTPPALSLPPDRIVQSSSSAGARVAYSASAFDRVDGPVTPSCSPASGTVFPVGKTTVTCTARDARGNAASGSFGVTVTPPSLPDLVIAKVTATSFTIANAGNAAAGPFVATVQGVGSFTVRGLAGGASITRTVQCGSTVRVVTVDAQSQVAESNEQNNAAKLPACAIP